MCNALLYYLSSPTLWAKGHVFLPWSTRVMGNSVLFPVSLDGGLLNSTIGIYNRHLRSLGKIGECVQSFGRHTYHLLFNTRKSQFKYTFWRYCNRWKEEWHHLRIWVCWLWKDRYSRNRLILNVQLREHSNATRSTLSVVWEHHREKATNWKRRRQLS